MELIEGIKTRRSVRKFDGRPVEKEVLTEVAAAAAFAPSWKNSQTARWNIITDKKLIDEIGKKATLGFEHNLGIITGAPCLAVESCVTGICGYEPDGSFTTYMEDRWEMYDSGIAAQTFCLAAHEKGLGCVIMGIIDGKMIEKMLNLPENEKVTAVLAVGYPAAEPKCPPKKTVEEIARFF